MATHAQSWRRTLPYLLGAAMFVVAVWVLHATLRRYHLTDLLRELEDIGWHRVGVAVLATGMSFVCLMGYEHSALRVIGRRVPWRKFSLASFCTQSISHSTGFAFFVAASLRYHFYAARGLTVLDVAKIQIYFTATFTLGVSTLAGSVIAVEPWRLANATHLPFWLWRLGAIAALLLVAAYVAWGALSRRSVVVRGVALTFPDATSTLIQIFWGVADLLAVAAALHALLPTNLHLGYIEVLSVFMASIVVGLVSNVPGGLGVFESAVILLIQPTPEQTLPLLGALLAFRACYYILPLACGISILALHEIRTWRRQAGNDWRRIWRQIGPLVPQVAAAMAFLAGALLLVATLTPVPEARAERLASRLPHGVIGFGNLVSTAGGLGLLVLARGLALRLVRAWRLGLMLLVVGLVVTLVTAESALVVLPICLALLVLLVAASEFDRPSPGIRAWLTPSWLVGFGVVAALAVWLLSQL